MKQSRSRRVVFLALASLVLLSCQLVTGRAPAATQHPTLIAPPAPAETGTPEPTIPPPNATIPPPSANTTTPREVLDLSAILGGTFQHLATTSDGSVWVVTGEEVLRRQATTFERYVSTYFGAFAGVDASGRVWVFSEDQAHISAWTGADWITYGLNSGWAAQAGYALGGQTDSAGRVWFATAYDVRTFDGTRWTVYTPEMMGMGAPQSEDQMARFAVTVLPGGQVWVSECDYGGPGPMGGRGARWLEGSTWQGGGSPVASGCATAVAADAGGIVWVGLEHSLWRFDPAAAKWEEYPAPPGPAEGLRPGEVLNLSLAPDGSPWVTLDLCGGASCGSSHALYHLTGGAWKLIGQPAAFEGFTWGPLFDADGVGWLAWPGAIYRLEGEQMVPVTQQASPAGVRDPAGRVWYVVEDGEAVSLWEISK